MNWVTLFSVLGIFFAVEEVDAQSTGGDAAITVPDSPMPGTALPHPNERMPGSLSHENSTPPEYSTEAAALTACGRDHYAWFDPATKTFLKSSERLFGKTANGFYACQN